MLPTLGARSFAAAAPALWNKLPVDIRNVASLNSLNLIFTLSPFNIVFNFILNFCKAPLIRPGKSAIEILNLLLLFIYIISGKCNVNPNFPLDSNYYYNIALAKTCFPTQL